MTPVHPPDINNSPGRRRRSPWVNRLHTAEALQTPVGSQGGSVRIQYRPLKLKQDKTAEIG